jgi:hypothetical protein
MAGRLIGQAEIDRRREARLDPEGGIECALGEGPLFPLVVADANPVQDFGIVGEFCALVLQRRDLRRRDRRRLTVAGACREQDGAEEK